MTPQAWIAAVRGGGTLDIDACIDALGDDLPLLHAFADTRQDPGWHAEGDVRVHTGMVLDELYADLARHPVSGDERLLLVLGALLHDIAKPLSTRDAEVLGRMRVVARGHEARGRSWLAPRLLGWGLPYAAVEEVLGIVGSHHEPRLLVKRDHPEGVWRRVARGVDPDRLARVELADMRGRTCQDRPALVEDIELFRMNAEELGVRDWEPAWRAFYADAFGHLPEAARDRAFGEAIRGAEEGRWRTPDAALWLGHAATERLPELVVLVGPSGAGKTTFAHTVLGREPWRHDVVSLDALRDGLAGEQSDQSLNGQVRQAARELLRVSLRADRRVVWDATSLRRDFRAPILRLGFDYGALVTIVAFADDPAGWARRNRARDTAVPPHVLETQLDTMEWPERHEAHRLLVVGPKGVLAWHGGLEGGLPYGLAWAGA
ncbi:MAG: ATP-binding protein [Myxococcota bacterium]